ncbi:MAG TPA: hypothetical protein VGE77_10930 [Nocardioides sp.]
MSDDESTTVTGTAGDLSGALDDLAATLLEEVPADVWAGALEDALDADPADTATADDLAGLVPDADDAVDGVLDVLEIDDDVFGEDATDGVTEPGTDADADPADPADPAGDDAEAADALDVLDVDDWSDAWSDGVDAADQADPAADGYDAGSDL